MLLVPDSIHWVTGNIAGSILLHNPWIEGIVISGPVLEPAWRDQPDLLSRFDLVHFLCPYAGREWLPRLRSTKACVTTHHHVTDWEAVAHNLDADAIMTDSSEWIDDLEARGFPRQRAVSVPTGVDTQLFRPPSPPDRAGAKTRLGIPAGRPTIGFFAKKSSNDDDRKGISVFSAAAVALVARMPEAAVVIVGPGWGELAADLRRRGVLCVWIPFVNKHRRLVDLYAALDFYWVTSRIEGGPVTLVEAMSCGVCCITTPVGIAREIADDGVNARVVPIGDAAGFVERTAELIADSARRHRLAAAARATVEARMSAEITMGRIRLLYNIALENFARRSPRAGTAPAQREAPPMSASTRRRLKMLEDAAWAEHLMLYHGERATAVRILLRAWVRNPRALHPLRVLLRRTLPRAAVAAITGLKSLLRRIVPAKP